MVEHWLAISANIYMDTKLKDDLDVNFKTIDHNTVIRLLKKVRKVRIGIHPDFK